MLFYSNFGGKKISEEQKKKAEAWTWTECHDVKMTPNPSSRLQENVRKAEGEKYDEEFQSR